MNIPSMKKPIISILLLLCINIVSAQSSGKITQTRELNSFTSVKLLIPATVFITQGSNLSFQISSTLEVLDQINTPVEGNVLIINSNHNDWSKLKADVIIRITIPKPNEIDVIGSGIVNIENNIITDYLILKVHGSGNIKAKDCKANIAQAGVYGSGAISMQQVLTDGLIMEIEGSGQIENDNISCRLASFDQSGSGNIKVNKINCINMEANITGSGNVAIVNGLVTNVSLQTAGSGSINAIDLVSQNSLAEITGSGNINITVLESLDTSIAGSGSVIYKGSPKNISKAINGSGSVKQVN